MKVIAQLKEARVQEIVSHINTQLKPLAQTEIAKCARGRMNMWLQAEPNYSTKKYIKAHSDDRLWSYLKQLVPIADLAQVYWSDGNIGIDWHRDAAYCTPNGYILNLGPVILASKATSKEDKPIELHLKGGELIQFNAKNLHKSTPLCPSRIGIGIWQAKISMNDPVNWQ
jgi:hypothetical protein